jgi:YD repeat-containing protein
MQVRGFAVALTGILFFGVMMAALATTPQAQALQQAPDAQQTQEELSMTRGELVSVDADARVIGVRAEDGQVWEFQYTDDTQVTGGQDGSAGLATMTGAIVTVHHATEGEVNVARLIEIAPEA